jgi:FtsP/CotA-like multicopper oxidase with cupredoxin domain
MAGQLLPGMLTFNGMYPGPQLRLSPGDRLRLRLQNRTGQSMNLHFHGFHVSPTGFQDNVFLDVENGADVEYDIPVPDDHPAGLYWYHPHLHGSVGNQVYSGLAGLIVVEGGIAARPDVAPLRKRTLAFNAVGINGMGSATPTLVPYPVPFAQAIHLVNGMLQPTIEIAPKETQFWQMVNIGTSAYYNLDIPGARIQIVEEDGGPVWRTTIADRLLLSPGKRFGILVTAPERPGQLALRTRGYYEGPAGNWPAADLATVTVQGGERESVVLPAVIGRPPSYLSEPVARRRVVVMSADFAPSPPVWNFDGVPYETITFKDVITVQRDTVEEWVIANSMTQAVGLPGESHPFHIHVNDFIIVERGQWDPVTQRITSRIAVNAPASMDTVNVDPGHYIKFRTRFSDFTGRTVFHCHILFHEDHGMMGVVDIVNKDGSGVGPHQLLPTQSGMHSH